MPKQSESQLAGYEGENWFRTQLPRGWIAQQPQPDVGVDFSVVICDASYLNGREFRVQVKSSTGFQRNDSNLALRRIKRSTLEYWFLSAIPTLIVAFESSTRTGYYAWHNKYIDLLELGKEPLLTLLIPETQVLNENAWDVLRENLRWHYSNLGKAIQSLRERASLYPLIFRLVRSARELNHMSHQPIPVGERTAQQHGLFAMGEAINHRKVVGTVSRFHDELEVGTDGHTFLADWLTAYISLVQSTFPNFLSIPADDKTPIPGDFQFAFPREERFIAEIRGRAIQVVLGLVMLVTASEEDRQKELERSSRLDLPPEE